MSVYSQSVFPTEGVFTLAWCTGKLPAKLQVTAAVAAPALAALGDVTQSGLVLFVSCLPRQAKQVRPMLQSRRVLRTVFLVPNASVNEP